MVERVEPVVVGDHDVGAPLQQQGQHVVPLLGYGVVQRGVAFRILRSMKKRNIGERQVKKKVKGANQIWGRDSTTPPPTTPTPHFTTWPDHNSRDLLSLFPYFSLLFSYTVLYSRQKLTLVGASFRVR